MTGTWPSDQATSFPSSQMRSAVSTVEEVELMAAPCLSRRRPPKSKAAALALALLQPYRPGQNGQLAQGFGAGGVALQGPLKGAGGLLGPPQRLEDVAEEEVGLLQGGAQLHGPLQGGVGDLRLLGDV